MSEKKWMLDLGQRVGPSNLTFLTQREADLAEARLGWMGFMISTMRNKIPSAQGIYFPPGTMTRAEQLRTAFIELDKPYPTPREARAIFDGVQGADGVFSYESDGRIWSIRAAANPTWEIARDEPWVLLLEGSRLEGSFACDELFEALRAMALLNGDHTERAVLAAIEHSAPQRRVVQMLRASNAIAEIDADVETPAPGFTFLGHSALQVQTPGGSIVVDPSYFMTHNGYHDPLSFQLTNRAQAVLISHNHWDHLTPATLVRLRRDMPMYVPRCHHRTYANPDMAAYLKLLGFTDIHEVDPWDVETIGEIKVTFAPFYGEPFGVDSRFDAFTYLIEANGQAIYGSVDGRLDEAGSMDPVIAQIADRARVDVFLFGSSNQQFLAPAVAGYAWRFSNDLIDRPELIRYHPNTDDALRWIKVLKPRYAIPFAQFLWDGAAAPDVALPTGETRKVNDVYDEYWQVRASSKTCIPLEGSLNGLATWKRRLDELRANRNVNLMMLHPLQRVVVKSGTSPEAGRA